MKICEGDISYISETAVRRNHLDRDKPSIVLQWKHVSDYKLSHTRCITVKPELLPNCDIAFGEDCGNEDAEELGEEEHDENNSSISDESQPMDTGKWVTPQNQNHC